MQRTLPAVALRQARLQLLENGTCPPGAVDARLARSWQRSVAAGLLPMGRFNDIGPCSDGEIRHIMASQHELLSHSRPVMEFLFEQVRHSQSIVILADESGTLMHTLGDANFLNKAERVALTNGVSWHEQHRGTNAIGTALAEVSGVEIHGSEHFLDRNGFLTCAAAPILSATGTLLGVLDISGDHRSGHPHSLGLVNTAARMIENQLIASSCRRNLRLHLHAQAEGLGTIAEGIVALSDDGWIVGANRAGLALLRITAANLGSTDLGSCMDLRLDDLLNRHRRRPQQIFQAHRHDGTALYVQLRQEHITLPEPATAVYNVVAKPRDALACLDTGDLRWRSAAEKTRRILDKPIPILIQGESGVGKEFFARAAHDSGPRRGAPFVAINCAAIPENLIEAELFGYASGAFTGARREGSLGRLREAHGGTLFLDEIGDMPLGMQTRLLRVLQERSVTPLGGRSVDVDFALICATHSKLREEADKGRFRSDLYYRINGLTVQLPALRERTDFQALTQRLLRSLNAERDIGLEPELLVRMQCHPWPGNLRQFASVLRTASAMLEPDEDRIGWGHLADDIAQELSCPVKLSAPQGTGLAPQSLEELSRAAIQQALASGGGNVSQAARSLGISRQTLYRKINAALSTTD
ncbi:MAG: sigma-54-dependent Fis family transcriptional regulator [Betaproteobacteria bacterium]